MPQRNDPRLMQASPAAALPADDPEAARLAAEVARLDAAVARMTQGLGFYEEPAHYAAAQRRLA